MEVEAGVGVAAAVVVAFVGRGTKQERSELMSNRRWIGLSLAVLLGILFVASLAVAQTSQVQGLIAGRSGATMTVKTADNETVVVALTADTDVQECEGMFKLRKTQQGLTALIPGLPVQVKSTINDKHQLVAHTVKFKASDLKTAQDIQAGLAPTQQEVQANAPQISANQQKIEAEQQQIQAEQAKIAANQAAIAAANKRFGELGEYNILGEVTVYFGNGKVAVESKYKPELLELAKKAKTIDAYIVQVQGYASSVGSAALNQKLGKERAENVLVVLEQDGNIPLTNILAPGAMDTSNPAASNAAAEGQAEDRRVVVPILQNKGIAGT
jgi:outer membrane protein OmpA-like peptidoglycan-associated protein